MRRRRLGLDDRLDDRGGPARAPTRRQPHPVLLGLDLLRYADQHGRLFSLIVGLRACRASQLELGSKDCTKA